MPNSKIWKFTRALGSVQTPYSGGALSFCPCAQQAPGTWVWVSPRPAPSQPRAKSISPRGNWMLPFMHRKEVSAADQLPSLPLPSVKEHRVPVKSSPLTRDWCWRAVLLFFFFACFPVGFILSFCIQMHPATHTFPSFSLYKVQFHRILENGSLGSISPSGNCEALDC